MTRAGILFIKNNKILLIKRNKNGFKYYAIPGGTLENDEEIKECAIREGKEETNLNFELTNQKPFLIKSLGNDEYYFFAKNIEGEPKMVGEEVERNTAKNSYELAWIKLAELSKTKLFPKGITKKILSNQK